MIINKRSSRTAIYEPDSLTEIEENASWKLKLWFCCTDKILKVEYTEVKCFELNTLTSVIFFITLALHFAMNKFFRVRLDCFLPLKLIWNEVLYLNTLIRRICAFIINQKYQDQKYCLLWNYLLSMLNIFCYSETTKLKRTATPSSSSSWKERPFRAHS